MPQTSRELWSGHQETSAGSVTLGKLLPHGPQSPQLSSGAMGVSNVDPPAVAPGGKLEELEDLLSLITSTSIHVPNRGWVLRVFSPHGQMGLTTEHHRSDL